MNCSAIGGFMKFDVIYTIEEAKYYNENGILIKSNVADDKMLNCQIASSLVEHLKKESATLKPDQLLLQFAEAQKRGITDSLEAMDEIALRAKASVDKMNELIIQAETEAEDKYLELEKRFVACTERVTSQIRATKTSLDDSMKQIEVISKRLQEVDNYKLSNIAEAVGKIVSLVDKDKDLVKLVLDYKRGNL